MRVREGGAEEDVIVMNWNVDLPSPWSRAGALVGLRAWTLAVNIVDGVCVCWP